MSLIKNAMFAVMLSLPLFSGANAFAQGTEGSFTVSPFAGGIFFEGDEHIKFSGIYGGRFGYNITDNIGAEFGFGYSNAGFRRNDKLNDSEDLDLNMYLYEFDAIYRFDPVWLMRPYVAAGAGLVHFDHDVGGDKTHALVDYGGGLEYFLVPDKVAVRADIRHLVTFQPGFNNLMVTGGLTFFFGGKEKEAAPPPPPPPAPAPEAAPPPPAPPAKVEAPVSPEVCIDLFVQFDFDKDDIKPEFKDEIKKAADYLVAHPKARGTIQGYTDAVGSEEYNMKLGQRRAESVKKYLVEEFGVAAGRLKTESFGKSHPLSTNLVEEGRAKNRRAVRVFCSESTGEVQPVTPEVCIGLRVMFDTGKAEVKPEYESEIKRVADYMKEHPEMTGTIEGYTDGSGSEQYNMKLSVERAEAVKKYLVERFDIPASRLTARGLGKTRPIADNSTPEGRALNRYAAEVFCSPAEEEK